MSSDRFLRANPNPVPLDQLKHPDFDVRDYRTDEDIANIRKSLERKGQIMPILLGQEENGKYPILDGNHRYLAAQRAGWHDIDAIQTKAGVESDEAQIIANISRLELAPSEKLATFDYMLNVLDMDVTTAAEEVGFDRSQVHRYKKILTGYPEIKEFFVQGELGVHACYELNQINDRDKAVDVAETAVREGYVDKDVIVQAKNVRGKEGAQDVMSGAGSEQNVQNKRQARKNAQKLQELDPVQQNPSQNPQNAPEQPEQPGQGANTQEIQNTAQTPLCEGCGEPMEHGTFTRIQFRPELAEQINVGEVRLGENCTREFVNWWAGLQEEHQAPTETLDGNEHVKETYERQPQE